jgi:DNA end-binding protein Ku
MALKLVEDMSEKWKPEQYRDTYREDILARVEEKIEAGESEIIAEPRKADEPRQSAEIVDLMALLKRSVGNKKGNPETVKRAAKKSASKKQAKISNKSTGVTEKRKRASA